jgi:hypothetical protein
MRHMRIHGRKVHRDRTWLAVLAPDPRDPDIVWAETIGPSGQRRPR